MLSRLFWPQLGSSVARCMHALSPIPDRALCPAGVSPPASSHPPPSQILISRRSSRISGQIPTLLCLRRLFPVTAPHPPQPPSAKFCVFVHGWDIPHPRCKPPLHPPPHPRPASALGIVDLLCLGVPRALCTSNHLRLPLGPSLSFCMNDGTVRRKH